MSLLHQDDYKSSFSKLSRYSQKQIWVRFLDHSTQIEGAKHVTPWAQTLLSCYRSMSDVERCYTFTSRHRSNYSNEKLDTTTESYCEIAIAESNKWQREEEGSHGPTVTDALQVRSLSRAVGHHCHVDKREKRLLLKQSMRRGLQMTLGAEVSDNDTEHRNESTKF